VNGARSAIALGVIIAAQLVLSGARQDAGSELPEVRPQQTPQPSSQQRPVFRAGANFVHVDAYPRKNGRVIDNLTAEDFDVYEDGVRQTIETFEIVRAAQHTPDAERRDPNTPREASALVADPHRRLFVVYLNQYFLTMEAARAMREPLITFLRQITGPEDLFGVMTPAITVAQLTFGRQMDVVESAVERYWRDVALNQAGGDVTPTTPYETMLYGCYIGRTSDPMINEGIVRALIMRSRLDDVFSGFKNLIQHFAVIREARSNIMFITSGFTLPGQNLRLSEYLWKRGPPAVGVGPSGRLTIGASQPNQIDGQACDRELMRLAMIEFNDRLDETVEIAGRAHVAFYPIHPAGLSVFDLSTGPRPAAKTYTQVEEILAALRRLALSTDGRAVVLTNDLKTPLREIASDLSLYYLLGYYSTNSRFDGKYRKIQVRLKPPGIDVAARPGYQPPSENDRRAAEASEATSMPANTAFGTALATLSRMRPDADIRVRAVREPGAIRVAIEIGRVMAGRPFWINGADVNVALIAADGHVGRTAEARISAGTRGVVVDLPLQDAGSWRATAQLSAGAITLQETVDVEEGLDGALGPLLLFRATPSRRSPLVAAVDPIFRRTERLHAEWTIGRTAVSADVTARLLDRNGAPLAIPVVLGTGTGADHRMSADINLAALTEGDYVLELMMRGDQLARRFTPIRVLR
jgi:VWFA-related protein